MKKVVVSVIAAIAVAGFAIPAIAGDLDVKKKKVVVAPPPPPNPWDVAFGGALMTDYVFRGITQSGHNPSVAGYIEPRYNLSPEWQLYAGISGESIKFPNNAAAEIDFYGGVRPTFGPLALDFGIWEYFYPGGTCWAAPAVAPGCIAPPWASGNVAKRDASFFEVYAKATYTMGDWAFGPTFYYSPNFLNLGADGEYLSGIVKFTAPASMALWNGQIGWYASGEFGHQWLGTSDAFYGGVRPTFGPLALDFGIWQYYYPGGTCFGNGALQPPAGTPGSGTGSRMPVAIWVVPSMPLSMLECWRPRYRAPNDTRSVAFTMTPTCPPKLVPLPVSGTSAKSVPFGIPRAPKVTLGVAAESGTVARSRRRRSSMVA